MKREIWWKIWSRYLREVYDINDVPKDILKKSPTEGSQEYHCKKFYKWFVKIKQSNECKGDENG